MAGWPGPRVGYRKISAIGGGALGNIWQSLEEAMDKGIITRDDRIVRTQEILESEVDGEVIALDVDKGQCYGMNAPASAIWHLLKTPSSPVEICRSLCEGYEVDELECERAVIAFVTNLHAEGLVRIDEA